MKNILLPLLLFIPIFVSGQTQDSITVAKQLDSLIRLIRPLVEQQKLDAALEMVDQVQQKTLARFGNNHPAYSIFPL